MRRLRLPIMQVTAVSDKTNTTGAARLGAFTEGKSQVALYDTPGVVHTRCRLSQPLQVLFRAPSEACKERLRELLAQSSLCTRNCLISMHRAIPSTPRGA